ncbi:MAG: hypothetical protein RI958_2606 [Actinomycetota bacterium]
MQRLDPPSVVGSLTLEQKVTLVAGADTWHTAAVEGLPVLRCSDGPAGVRGTSWSGPPSASFPCGTSLGATFDPELVEAVGQALGREARSKGAHILLAPTVNLHRTPIGGRNFECMSEDPTLTAHLASAYVRGVQSQRVAACIKHFVANDTEHERMTISSEVDARTLRELYLVPFEVSVLPVDEGGGDVRVVMSSYNRVNGVYAGEHQELLRTLLRDEWGFDGVVVSDWFGTQSTAAALEAGLDLEMPGPTRHRGERLMAAVRSGQVSEARLDESVTRLLELMRWCGLDDPDETWSTSETTDDAPETRALIRRAAISGTVLLRNDSPAPGTSPLLPLEAGEAGLRVALIGPNSERGQLQGGGSARVRASRPVPILGALRERGLDVRHHRGCVISRRLPVIRGRFEVEYTSGDGTSATVPIERTSLLWADRPADGIDISDFGCTISGQFAPDVSGTWEFGLMVVGSAVLRVNGAVVVDLSEPQTGSSFFGMGSPEVRATVELEAGSPCHVEVTYPVQRFEMLRGLRLGATPVVAADEVAQAAALAADADVAVVVVGTDDEWETEGEDRSTMDLPGRQDELIAAVVAANPNTVVVINAGSPVTMPWLEAVPSVMQIWFPGEECGNAVADMLTGVAEPGGRLPITVPRRLADTPAHLSHPGVHGRAHYGEGLFIGYRWYDAREIEPAFPFGHGLGYTTWAVTATSISGTLVGPESADSAEVGVTVTVEVTNTGSRPGSTVVQCYVESPPGLLRPLRELRGFARVHADPGHTATAQVWLPERAFSTWDSTRESWFVPTGAHHLHVGLSSRDLRVAGSVVR